MALSLRFFSLKIEAKSTGAVEYTDCISADRQDSPNKCREFGTKQSDGEASVMLEFWGVRCTPYWHRSQVQSEPEWRHLIGSYL